jgi:hypothetical protein
MAIMFGVRSGQTLSKAALAVAGGALLDGCVDGGGAVGADAVGRCG